MLLSVKYESWLTPLSTVMVYDHLLLIKTCSMSVFETSAIGAVDQGQGLYV